MNLERGEQARGLDAEMRGHAPAVFRYPGGVVIGANSAIEAFVNAIGHAAIAGEERMTQAGNGGEQWRSQCHEVSTLSSAANPASTSSAGSEIATTLNIDPMPPRPP